MNRKTFLLIALSCFLVACSKSAPPGPLACEPYSGPEPPCNTDKSQEDTRGAPHVTINSNTLRVQPACVRAFRDATITFNLVPVADNKPGSARIFPKDKNKWLAGTNDSDKDKIVIVVPKDQPSGDHWYGFEVNGKCVDPRVHVENN